MTLIDADSVALAARADSLKQNSDRIITVVGDVSQPQCHDDYVSKTVAKWGRLDISVQCAGVCAPPTSIVDTSVEVFDNTFNVNSRGGEYHGRRVETSVLTL